MRYRITFRDTSSHDNYQINTEVNGEIQSLDVLKTPEYMFLNIIVGLKIEKVSEDGKLEEIALTNNQ